MRSRLGLLLAMSLVASVTAGVLIVPVGLAGAGALDASFGASEKVATDFETTDISRDMVRQPDGEIPLPAITEGLESSSPTSPQSWPRGGTLLLTGAQASEGDYYYEKVLRFTLRAEGSFDGSTHFSGIYHTHGEGEGYPSGNTPPTATPDIDYESIAGGFSFSWVNGWEEEIIVPVLGDTTVEPDEFFYLHVQSTDLVLGELYSTGVILNDDLSVPESSLSIDDVSVVEGDAGTTTADFNVTLSPAASSTVTVDYSTCGAGCDPAATANVGVDYQIAIGTLTFPPGETSLPIPVTVNGDIAVEADETFYVNLLDPVGATVIDTKGLGIIVNDDGASVNSPPVAANDGPYSVDSGAAISVGSPGVLGNDTDAENDALTAIKVSDPAHGTLTLAADGSFVYVHDGSVATTDSFTYRAFDGTDQSAPATVSITITQVLPKTLGATTVGLVDPASGLWHLRNGDGLVTSFYYGNPGDVPFVGDWDCDGDATPGLFRTSDAFAYLRNSNSVGIADIRFFFGNPSDIPLAGDFNGDGCDTLSIYRPSEQRFFIMNKLGVNEGGLGAADYSFLFGNPGDQPVVGDWDGDGIDEVGLHRESSGFFYYRNSLDTGIASGEFYFGDPGDRFVAGDWGTVDGVQTPAVFRPSNTTFYFRWTNTPGVADSQFTWGTSAWLPVAGEFGL